MGRQRGCVRLGALAAAIVCAIASAACGVFAEQPMLPTSTPPAGVNVIRNAGFEHGPEPWFATESSSGLPSVSLSTENAHSGAFSLSLSLAAPAAQAGSGVSHAVQRIDAAAFPEFLSGYYYVDEWQPAQPFQYIEFVVTVLGGFHPDGLESHEVRFIIAGAPSEPAPLEDGRYVFLSRDEPPVGEWTYFSYPVLEAIRTHLSWDPAGWDRIEVAFEVRYAGKQPGEAASAHVYFDDLYFGPQIYNPNRPPDD